MMAAPCYEGVSRSLGKLDLLDMPESVIQHISTFVPSQQWAKKAVFLCRKLDGLQLPALKVRTCYTE